MRIRFGLAGLCLAAGLALGAERVLDFSGSQPGTLPTGFATFVAGGGRPADWQVVMDELPTEFTPFTPKAATPGKWPVLAQVSRDPTDERFPVAYLTEEKFGDFTLRARVKIVGGAVEQMAGLVFRLQDEKNFYVARINVLDGNVRFYKFVNGERGQPVGNNLTVAKGVWHEFQVTCTGNRIEIRLNGQEAVPALTDNSFAVGRIGFMTKSDSVAHFADARLTYTPLVSLAQKLATMTLEKQKRLVNLRIYGQPADRSGLQVLAGKYENEVGLAAGEVEENVFRDNEMYAGRVGKDMVVTAPLRDRNGDPLGVVKLFMKPFPGQTEANAVARSEGTLKELQSRIGAARSLLEE